jgi:hypothetical protein
MQRTSLRVLGPAELADRIKCASHPRELVTLGLGRIRLVDHLCIDPDRVGLVLGIPQRLEIARRNTDGRLVLTDPLVDHLGDPGGLADEDENRRPGVFLVRLPRCAKLVPVRAEHCDGVVGVLEDRLGPGVAVGWALISLDGKLACIRLHSSKKSIVLTTYDPCSRVQTIVAIAREDSWILFQMLFRSSSGIVLSVAALTRVGTTRCSSHGSSGEARREETGEFSSTQSRKAPLTRASSWARSSLWPGSASMRSSLPLEAGSKVLIRAWCRNAGTWLSCRRRFSQAVCGPSIPLPWSDTRPDLSRRCASRGKPSRHRSRQENRRDRS